MEEDNDTSSEDEMFKEALREAIDPEFFKDSLLKGIGTDNNVAKSTTTNSMVSVVNKPSNRIKESKEHFENFKLSDSCREYIAKMLHNYLDKNIVMGDVWKLTALPETSNQEHGIKLLNSSKVNVTLESCPVEYKSVKRKKKTFDKEEEKLNISKCKEVAVDADWILSKTETKVWADTKKGTVFKYKKQKNGTLVEEVKPFVSQEYKKCDKETKL